MAIKIKFDLARNPESPTILLANRNGNILGQLDVDTESIDISDKFNDASEFSFTVYKYVDDKLTNLWDKLVDFKLVYCKEWDEWFEIKVELDEATETIKDVFCTQLEKAELSQLNLYNIEINTENDIKRDDYDEKYPTLFYRDDHTEASLLHRLLKDKAPHYSIIHVDKTLKDIKKILVFTFDGTSIDDAFQEIAEEIGCVFIYHSYLDEDKILRRTISVYDLQQNCNDCGHRGEFTDKCPKCGRTNIKPGYGKDTLIFVTSDELASEGIQLVTDTDSVKNCFKLEAGDDLMTATIRNCNPNGTDYLWYFSDAVKEDMSKELVDGIESYDAEYKKYYNDHISNLDVNLVSKYNALVENYKKYYNTKSTCINCKHEEYFEDTCPQCGSTNILSGKTLQTIPTTIKGYSTLMNAYYNTIDLALYLQSGLMPTVEMGELSKCLNCGCEKVFKVVCPDCGSKNILSGADYQASLLTSSSLSPVAVNNEKIEGVSLATANSAVLSMAKIIVRSTYKVEVGNSNYDKDTHVWSGNFVITNYSDENDTAESQTIEVIVNNDTETFVKQKIEKALNKEDTDDYSISGLFEKGYDDFVAELKGYALNPLKSFYDACDNCLNILIDNGVGNKDEKPDLYEKLYVPYYNKSSAISEEMKLREKEIAVIEGVWDKTDENNPKLVTKGLQQYIEECRNEIQSALDFEKYLGEELWLEFCAYRREDTYSNDNYISDGLNNAQLFERALKFYEVAENEIYKSAELQHSISTSLNNLLAIDKFKPLVDSFEVGNWIRVRVDDKIFKLRLLEYEIDFGSFENISVEFSDVTKVKNGITDVKSVIEQASSMATNYSSIQRQADKGEKAKDVVEQWTTDGLNTALVQIQNNNNEEVVMTKSGILARSYDDITGEYLPEQLRITHNIMAYTDDNWQTVSSALGKHNYIYYDENQKKQHGTDYGLSSKFVTAGYISGSQIIGGDIYSNNYVSGKSGSFIDLESGKFEFGGGKITFNGTELIVNPDNGVGLTEDDVVSITDGCIKAAEIDAEQITTGKLDAERINADGISAKDVNLTGTITANKGSIGGEENGWLIEDGYIGLATWDENNCSNNVAISSKGVNADISDLGGGGYDLCLLYFKGKFAVDDKGTMYATGAKISGDITAKTGKIGCWTIDDSSIYKNSNVFGDSSGMYFGEDGLSLGSEFKVNSEGNVTATSGTIGGFTLNSNEGLYSGGVGINAITSKYAFYAGETNGEYGSVNSNAAFKVGHNGHLVAVKAILTEATITGTITNSVICNGSKFGDTGVWEIGTETNDYAIKGTKGSFLLAFDAENLTTEKYNIATWNNVIVAANGFAALEARVAALEGN